MHSLLLENREEQWCLCPSGHFEYLEKEPNIFCAKALLEFRKRAVWSVREGGSQVAVTDPAGPLPIATPAGTLGIGAISPTLGWQLCV